MAEPESSDDLTTGRAPFLAKATARGQVFIDQPNGLYSERNRATWQRLFERQVPLWRRNAHPRYLEGLEILALSPESLPQLDAVNRSLQPISAFQAKAVAGHVPAFLFFDCLRRREFPTTISMRDAGLLDHPHEPDLFHDVAGHLPMHAERRYGDVLVRLGEVARAAARRAGTFQDTLARERLLESNLKALTRVFFFTVENGLMLKPGSKAELCAYGRGLLASHGELQHAVEQRGVQRYPFQLEWVVNQACEHGPEQSLFFFVDGFDHLFDEVDRLERWIQVGRLDAVCPGDPDLPDDDLNSFLAVACT